MRTLFFIVNRLLVVATLKLPCLAQTEGGFLTRENLVDVKDSVLRWEVSTFTATGKKLLESKEKTRLGELKLCEYSPNRIGFRMANFFSSTFIAHIYLKENLPQIKEVYFLIGKYFPHTLPDSAISDIYDPPAAAKLYFVALMNGSYTAVPRWRPPAFQRRHPAQIGVCHSKRAI